MHDLETSCTGKYCSVTQIFQMLAHFVIGDFIHTHTHKVILIITSDVIRKVLRSYWAHGGRYSFSTILIFYWKPQTDCWQLILPVVFFFLNDRFLCSFFKKHVPNIQTVCKTSLSVILLSKNDAPWKKWPVQLITQTSTFSQDSHCASYLGTWHFSLHQRLLKGSVVKDQDIIK